MRRLVVLASALVIATGAAGCGRDAGASRGGSPTAILGPTAIGDGGAPTVAVTGGKGGSKPTGGSSSTFSLVMTLDNNGDGLPNWGDSVTFDVATTATTEPHVDLKCSQNGTVVLGATSGFYDSYPWPWTQVMTLSSTSWQGGAASCTATLYYFSGRKNVVLSTLTFDAQG